MYYERSISSYKLVSATDKLGVPYMDWRTEKYLDTTGSVHIYGSETSPDKKHIWFAPGGSSFYGFRTSAGDITETENGFKIVTENSIYEFAKE